MDKPRLSYPNATLVRRFEAGVTTGVPAFVLWFLINCGIGCIFPVEQFFEGWGLSARAAGLVFAAVAVLISLAWVLFDGVLHGATYGMRNRKLVILRPDGQPAGPGRSLARIALGVLLTPLVPVSMVLVLLDARRRGLADRICGTVIGSGKS